MSQSQDAAGETGIRLDDIKVVLVHTSHPGNIGAAAGP